MTVKAQLIAALLLAGVATAQSAPASQTVKPNATQKPVASGSKPATQNGKSPFAPKPASPQAAASQATAKPAVPKQAAPKPAATTHAKTVAPAAAKKPQAAAQKAPAADTPVAENAPAKLPNPGKRDPFLSPIAAAAMKVPANCSVAGKRCLVIDQLTLKGVVQMKSGNLALVENAARKPYFLKENDALFNANVVKITADSVIFEEHGTDLLGRPTTKEVVKKVSAPSV